MNVYDDGQARFYCGDSLTVLRELPDESVNCVVTSPPYWGLRDYGCEGQIGLEETPALYLDRMVAVFAEVRRVLRSDGTAWVNMGDGYSGGGGSPQGESGQMATRSVADSRANRRRNGLLGGTATIDASLGGVRAPGLKAKDLIGMPWMLAFALRADGWYLRSEIIWHKPNPMPESVTDRPTKSHEQIFLLTKSARYWYDADAIREPASGTAHARGNGVNPKAIAERQRIEAERAFSSKRAAAPQSKQNPSFSAATNGVLDHRNKRDVWTVATEPYPEAHFATFPESLIEPCILAGCPEGGTVLDPFLGSGTTAAVAKRLGRKAIGIELNPAYLELAKKRCLQMGLPALSLPISGNADATQSGSGEIICEANC